MLNPLRNLPAVETLLQALGPQDLPRPLVVSTVRRHLATLRRAGRVPPRETVIADLQVALARRARGRLQPVINATGVVIHTNLGRAPLGPAAVEALRAAATGYTNLELDLDRGERGSRGAYVEEALALLCGAPAAMVVNNCAAALVLILRHLTAGDRKDVLISRGELVQIGGGFRIPEVLESSGARLREVGTTNRTTVADYARAAGRGTALLLKVHRSNFFMEGFVESPSTEALAAWARRQRLPFVEDLGSGAVVATDYWSALDHEPTPAEVLSRGVDLVCFSGDKLLGGPQAGIIAGRASRVAALKREPFFRALRCDKLVLAALQATAEAYLRLPSRPAPAGPGAALRDLPVLALLSQSPAMLRQRAEQCLAALAGLPVRASIGTGRGQVGGGTLPRTTLDSVTLELEPTTVPAGDLAARLRAGSPPVVGYVAGGRLKLDLRTVFPEQDPLLAEAIARACR